MTLITEAQIDAAVEAQCRRQWAPHELPLDPDLLATVRETARLMLEAAAREPALPQDADTLENARTLATHYQTVAAQQGTQIIRLRIALKILREFGGIGEGFHGGVMATIKPWLDGDMKEPVPYPESVFFDTWAKRQGLSNIDGHVGYRLTMQMVRP